MLFSYFCWFDCWCECNLHTVHGQDTSDIKYVSTMSVQQHASANLAITKQNLILQLSLNITVHFCCLANCQLSDDVKCPWCIHEDSSCFHFAEFPQIQRNQLTREQKNEDPQILRSVSFGGITIHHPRQVAASATPRHCRSLASWLFQSLESCSLSMDFNPFSSGHQDQQQINKHKGFGGPSSFWNGNHLAKGNRLC